MSAEFKLGGWLVQPQLNLLRRGEKRIRIEPQVMDLLVYMTTRPDEVLHKDRIIEAVWGRAVGDDVLSHGIFELRKALGDDARNPRFIETIPRRGYRLIASVDFEEKAVDTEKPQPGRKSLLWASAAVAVAALALFLLGHFGGFWGQSQQPSQAHGIRSVAVLPLRNLSGDAEQEYFADGMTEMLITSLAKMGLPIPSATSSMYYKGHTEKPLTVIARELNVDAVLGGSTLQADGRVLVNLQLVDAATDRHLWAENYERELVDVPALLHEVSLLAARAIDIHLADSYAKQRVSQVRKVDPEAFDDYLKGLFFRGRWSGGNLESSLDYFLKSAAKDPDYAPAYVELSSTYSALAFVHLLPQQETYDKARQAAEKALEIDDTSAEAWAALGAAKLFVWDWKGAEGAINRALELNQNMASVQDKASYFFMAKGRQDESVRAIKRALRFDPFSVYTNLHVGWSLYNAGRYDEAIAHLLSTKDLYPENSTVGRFLASNYEAKGLYDEAMRERNCPEASTLDRASVSALGCLRLLALTGGSDEVRRILTSLLAGGESFRRMYVAHVFAALGEEDLAFDQLEQAFEERDSDLVFLGSDPALAPLRGDARFADLLQRMGVER